MKHFCKILLFLLLFPIVVFGQSELDMLPVQHHIVEGLSPIMLFGRNKLCTIPVYKISKSNVKRHLKKEIRKAYDYLDNDKKNIYYGIIVLTHYPKKVMCILSKFGVKNNMICFAQYGELLMLVVCPYFL